MFLRAYIEYCTFLIKFICTRAKANTIKMLTAKIFVLELKILQLLSDSHTVSVLALSVDTKAIWLFK